MGPDARTVRAGSCPVIRLVCRCGATLHLPAPLAGQVGRCPGCGDPLRAPEPARAPAPAPSPRAHEVVRVRCACGRRVPVPRARLEQGLARCPSCDAPLDPATPG